MIQTRRDIIFITGTDTDVGKTMVSLLMLRVLAAHNPVYLKPVQTGCVHPDIDSDPAYVARHLPGGLPRGMRPEDCMAVCHPIPKAPLFAGAAVELAQMTEFVLRHAGCGPVVVEGAGGILVPLTWSASMLDLACALQARIVVVARAGLGTINHTLLTLQAISGRGCPCLGVVLVDAHDAVDALSRAENMHAIGRLAGVPVWGVIGREEASSPTQSALDVMRRVLEPACACNAGARLA